MIASSELSDFDYDLPERLIASHPVPVRDESRMMILHRSKERIEHGIFRDVRNYLCPEDVMVVNQTKVIRARLLGEGPGGGKVELLLLGRYGKNLWKAMGRPGRRLRVGALITFDNGLLTGKVIDLLPKGLFTIHLQGDDVAGSIERIGRVPLPPYLHRADIEADRERYQTVYAKTAGAVAAPTAGLHFTEDLLDGIRNSGVDIVPVLLQVGPATFRPVSQEELAKNKLEGEFYRVGSRAARRITAAKENGGRIIAVGTTTVRALETASDEGGVMHRRSGTTEIFIRPPYTFKAVDALITNFHLPLSSLLMLVSAFAGKAFIVRAYREAVERGYRFYSYGDAMLIL